MIGDPEAGYRGSQDVFNQITKERIKDADMMREIRKSRLKKSLDNKDDLSFAEKEALKLKNAKELAGYKSGLNGEEDKSGPDFKDVTALRKDYMGLPTTKDTQAVNASYSRIQNTMSKKPSPAGDMAMVFNFMKMLDPGSVVRESEFRTAGNRRGLPDVVQNWFDIVKTGKILTDKQRSDFLNQTRELYKAQQEVQNPIKARYSEIAKRYNIPETDVVVPLEVKRKLTYEENMVDSMSPKHRKIYLEALNSNEDDAQNVVDYLRGIYAK